MTDAARETGKRLQSIDPEFRISRLASYLGPYQQPEFLEKYAEGSSSRDCPNETYEPPLCRCPFTGVQGTLTSRRSQYPILNTLTMTE